MSVVVQDVIEVVIMVMVFGLGSILMGEGGFVKYMCVYVCGVSSMYSVGMNVRVQYVLIRVY